MKNQEKITEIQERIKASGVYEAIKTKGELFGEYIQLEDKQKYRKEIGIAFLEVIEAVWKLEATLENVINKSRTWEKKDRISDKDNSI